ncbi:hypothetical protein [Marinagarivorans cellulosilyticus]|uniref:Lipoprotein n=1 Tax=Marinagarivorans cellulosilyticus TaxID=2721545 RepID=A0AAN1WFH8_9GAMM|nr:hypothetical protein [Marinagarivorans cellulosilyticus]BCD96659.1 hypothetical protein MARGE09_P0859 [Marinagarivorans cellulosilyticus]
MKLKLRKISPKWLVLGLMSAVAVLAVGCQGSQTKIDLPSPTGAPAYLVSVSPKSSPKIYSPSGEAYQKCETRKCEAMLKSEYAVDTKALSRVFKESKAVGGFTILNFQEMKQIGIFNIKVIESAHADPNCAPLFVLEYGLMDYSYFFPPDCPIP